MSISKGRYECMRSVRILLTEDCNANCSNCLNQSFRAKDKYINVSKFSKLCKYFQENDVLGVKIMGGEPTIHPEFEQLINIAQENFKRVSVFTNAITDRITIFHPREEDGISYNFRFRKHISKEKLLLQYPGYRALEILVDDKTCPNQILEESLSFLKYYYNRVSVMLTLDCTNGIFKKRSQTLPILEKIYLSLISEGITVGLDHAIPVCYIYGSKIPVYGKGVFCDTGCAGLVDSSCNLRYCNQHNSVLINLFSEGKIIPFQIFENHLNYVYFQKQIEVMDKICKECICYGKICNGGCFIGNNFDSREDILENTNLPVI